MPKGCEWRAWWERQCHLSDGDQVCLHVISRAMGVTSDFSLVSSLPCDSKQMKII